MSEEQSREGRISVDKDQVVQQARALRQRRQKVVEDLDSLEFGLRELRFIEQQGGMPEHD